MMKYDDNFTQVKSALKQVRFNIKIDEIWYQTEWMDYNVVGFTNRCVSLINQGFDYNVENRNV
jgi:hypothetical protein